jgi:hypothetical protein
MKKFQVIGSALSLGAGTIELTEAQAKVRLHALDRVKGNVYKINNVIQFKVGEIIGLDAELPKTIVDRLQAVAVASVPVGEALAAALRK